MSATDLLVLFTALGAATFRTALSRMIALLNRSDDARALYPQKLAADAVQQGVCTPAGADAAMKLGVNYPAGPFEWLARWSVAGVTQVLEALDAQYRGERYRISPWLRRQRA